MGYYFQSILNKRSLVSSVFIKLSHSVLFRTQRSKKREIKTQFQIGFVEKLAVKLGDHDVQQRNAHIFYGIFNRFIAKRFLTS